MSEVNNPDLNGMVCHGAHLYLKNNTKLYDLRNYSEKPIFGHALPAYENLNFKQVELLNIKELKAISKEVAKYFELIFEKTERFNYIMEKIKNSNLNVHGSLPVVFMNKKVDTEVFFKLGIHIDEFNYNNDKTYLYFPLSLMDQELEDIIKRLESINV